MKATIALIVTALMALPASAQQAWWTPVPVSPPMPAKMAWWTPVDCKVDVPSVSTEDEYAYEQARAYSSAYDKALSGNKPLVLFVGIPARPIGGALTVRYDAAELKDTGAKAPTIFVGRGCHKKTLCRTAILPATATDEQIVTAMGREPNCPPQPLAAAEAEFSGLPAMLAAAAIGAMTEQAPDCFGPNCPPWAGSMTFNGRSAPAIFNSQPFYGGGSFTFTESFATEQVFVATRRVRGPFRRLFNAVRMARQAPMMRLTPMTVTRPVESWQTVSSPQPTTYTRYEWTPVATYKLEPVTQSVPVTSYRWVEQKPEMPARK